MITTACIQLNSTNNIEANLEQAEQLIRQAVAKGAKLVTLPENATIMEEQGARIKAQSPTADTHIAVKYFQQLAQSLDCWIIVGSIPVSVEHDEKLANRCFVFNNNGTVSASYDKIHLFDANPKPGEHYTESHRYLSGDTAIIVNTPWAKIGLSICYDLRFPHLFRTLAQAGAECIIVPSAFTYTTGKDHWHVLLRARAIETGCYIIAPAQCGTHPGNRKTYGHSLIIDPWGHIIAEADEQPGIILATLDIAQVHQTRKALPSLSHDREIKKVIEC